MRTSLLLWSLPLVAACSASIGCSESEPAGAEISVARSSLARETPVLTDEERTTFAADRADFAVDLLRKMTEGTAPGNVLVSPQSASVALAMTYAGSGEATKTAMAKALRFTQPEATTHAAFNATDLGLAARQHEAKSPEAGAVQLSSANSVWSRTRDIWEAGYLDTLAKHYDAGVNLVDFGQAEAAASAINGWVSGKTNERIPELLTKEDVTGASWVLVNAIYLKANWASRFDKASTHDAPFHAASGATVTAPTMMQRESFRAVHRDDYDAVEIPYDGGQLAMVIVAPNGGTVSSLVGTLKGRDLLSLPLVSQLVDLWMPKFETRTTGTLTKQLEQLGMPTKGGIFPGGADEIAVVQEDWLAADEAGTEAAAATAVIGIESSAPVEPPKTLEVRLDRPFLYAIVDKPTGAILFLGELLDPTAK